MKRVAVIFEEDIFNPKGAFNAKLQRIRHLKGFEVTVFCIQTSYGPVERFFLPRRSISRISEKDLGHPWKLVFEGVEFKMLWKPYSILDHFLFYKLHVRPLRYPRFLRKCAELLKDFDLVSAHSFEGGLAALEANRLYGVPFTMTWHGSDIHTKPFKYRCIFARTASLISGAEMNFFVSKALLDKSEHIGPGKKMVLYNGCDSAFHPFAVQEKCALRARYGVSDSKVVCFAGALVPVKNASLLPKLFESIKESYAGNLSFWIVGGGPLMGKIEAADKVGIRFFGDVHHARMAEIFNCADLIVLPSLNEGLPLVLLEAVSCGCRAVGSNAGGIPEVIGEEHCVDPEAHDFVQKLAAKAVEALDSSELQTVNPDMDWAVTAEREASAYKAILEA